MYLRSVRHGRRGGVRGPVGKKNPCIYAVVPDRTADAVRRIELPYRRLRSELGQEYDIKIVPGITPADLEKGALFVCHKHGGPRMFDLLMHLAKAGKRAIFDLSFSPRVTQSNPLGAYVARMHPYLELVLSNVDAVTVNTQRLADEIRPFHEGTVHIPSYLEDRVWGDVKKPPPAIPLPGSVTICWSARNQAAYDLVEAWDALEAVMSRYPLATLMHFAGHPLGGIPVGRQIIMQPADYLDMPSLLARADVGIVPRGTTNVSDSACVSPALEFGALGIPVVASPTLPYRSLAAETDGITLAKSTDEWVEALSKFIEDASLRQRAGEALRKRSADERLSKHLSEYASVIRRVMSGKARRIAGEVAR